MNDLLVAITDLVANQTPDKSEALSSLIKQCASSEETSALDNWSSTPQSKQQLKELLKIWKTTLIDPDELAGMITGASYAYHTAKAEEKLELVWTGPSTPMMSTRRTEQALLEVINSSHKTLFLVSFVAYEVASVTKALNEAIERGVDVSILLEPAEVHGGQIKEDCFAMMKYAVPNASLYVWSDKNKEEMGGGYRIVHAKCSIADAKVAFITSANLTGAALERNMELGVLISGNNIPQQLYSHLQSLISTKTLDSYKGI